MMSSKMRRRAMSARTKRTTRPSMRMRRKKTSLMLKLRHLKTKTMTLMVMRKALNRRLLTKKLMINKMQSNLKRTLKKIPESQAKMPCQLSPRDVVLDQNKMLNSVETKRQRVVAAVAGERALKWSIGLKSKLQRKPTQMVRMLREKSKKSVQRIRRRTQRLKLMQL